jgi:hypothetical protein
LNSTSGFAVPSPDFDFLVMDCKFRPLPFWEKAFQFFPDGGDRTEQVQRHGLVGIGLQNLLIYDFGYGQFTLAVMLHGKVLGLLDV